MWCSNIKYLLVSSKLFVPLSVPFQNQAIANILKEENILHVIPTLNFHYFVGMASFALLCSLLKKKNNCKYSLLIARARDTLAS